MLNITILCVGRIKEKYYTMAVTEYIKRLSRYVKAEIIEVRDEPIPDAPSEVEKNMVIDKEAERLIAKLPKNAYIMSLCVEGRGCSSEEFAEKIERLTAHGVSRIVFVIGGSLGLSEEIKKMSAERLSFSEMTLPHQLMRVVLAEQIYRAITINNNITYHK